MVTEKEVHACLREFKIRSEDTILIHTSMRAIGGVEGGCDGLIDAFCAYLHKGLFLVPTHTWSNVGSKNPVFDVRATKPCIGALPTVAAARPDGVRSLHPTHSMAAFGKRAAEYVKGEENCGTPCPPGGCWARLYDEGAKILLIGVGLNRNTFIHAVDERIGLPGRLVDPIPLTIVDQQGAQHSVSFQKHGKTGSEFFDNYHTPLQRAGALTYGRLGEAEVICCDARRCTEVISYLWTQADYDLCGEPREIPEGYYEALLT